MTYQTTLQGTQEKDNENGGYIDWDFLGMRTCPLCKPQSPARTSKLDGGITNPLCSSSQYNHMEQILFCCLYLLFDFFFFFLNRTIKNVWPGLVCWGCLGSESDLNDSGNKKFKVILSNIEFEASLGYLRPSQINK